MDKALISYLSSIIGSPVLDVHSISGGDISHAYKLATKSDVFFCKVQMKPEALEMFTAERSGLSAIRKTGVIKAPEVYYCEPWREGAVLVMEFLESKRPTESDLARFGRHLAEMHQQTNHTYGWESDNFIGSLPQSNAENNSWTLFYVQERLIPQLDLAVKQGMLSQEEVPSGEKMTDILEELFAGLKPGLLHGDLWGGNYMIRSDGNPYLIDPAVYYGHNEVDIAMSRLFGGFGQAFYNAYESTIIPDQLSDDRIRIYQLYYLLVHLNLFGRSYYSGVIAALKSYFY